MTVEAIWNGSKISSNLKEQCHDIQWFFALFLRDQTMATARANVSGSGPWQLGQPREQLHRPGWIEQISFSAALPCGRHYFSHTKWPPKITDYCDTAALRQDPLEAILVIFACRALIFFKLLEKYENDTTFVRMHSGDHLGDAKMSKKRAPRSVEFNFLSIVIDRNGFCIMKEEGQMYKPLPQIFYFLPRDLVMIIQSFVTILPRFSTLKDPN